MKTHTIFLSSCIFFLWAVLLLGSGRAFGQEVKDRDITLSVRNEPVEQVLKQVSKLTHIKFFYDQRLMENRPLVTLDVSRVTLNHILKELTKQTSLLFIRSNQTVTVVEPTSSPTSQRVRNCFLSGQVVDASTREPLSGANVYLPRYRQGQITDEKGCFKLPVPCEKSVEVRISFVGYTGKSYHLTLLKDTVLNVGLHHDNRLSEVEVYAAKQDFGVESSQMSAIELPIEEVRRLPALFGEVDLLKALQKIPGVQSSNDGQAGIVVRGGNYDQNQIMMDGSTLYNAEHLKGFVSAINSDMVDNLIFYKGAFPARYGGQLSSVVDVGMKSGNMKHYHGELSVGMLSSRLHVEGPIWKDRTSFNIGARASYFDWVVHPLLKKVVDNKDLLASYANMNYFDVSAKLTHLFSDRHRLSAFFYMGNDVNDASPTASSMEQEVETTLSRSTVKSGTENSWGNIVSNLYWTYRPNERFRMNTQVGFSRYRYDLKQQSYLLQEIFNEGVLKSYIEEDAYVTSLSGIDELSGSVDFHYQPVEQHDLRWGVKFSHRTFDPTIELFEDGYSKIYNDFKKEYVENTWHTDTVMGGNKQRLSTASLYVEDDWQLSRQWRANVGLRYALFHVTDKMYHSVEPRLSLRWMFRDDMSLKLSYARMAQGFHLLSSSNLVMPSDMWVSVTKDLPLMRSDQLAMGYNYALPYGLNFSIEGFYKRMDNLLEYREGSSVMNVTDDWRSRVVTGEGEAYGVELLLQKTTGKTTGWVGYTWSKSLRRFNRPGEELFSGKTYYAGNDRRHNLNIVANHRFNKHWDVSLTWTYQSGRRGSLSTTALQGGMPDDFGAGIFDMMNWYGDFYLSSEYMQPTHVHYFPLVNSYKERNGYLLPPIHRLDVGVTYTIKHKLLESRINLSVYNLYNRRNISTVYMGYKDNRPVLKGICLIPIMPSISYTLNF